MRLSDSGLAGAIACWPSTCALLHHRMSPGISRIALSQRSSARFTSILCSASPRPCLNVVSIHALEPDFYKIPYVDGIPVGKRLKLWNLPLNCKHSELLEWFAGVDVVVESLELTNDPALNAQGIGGFVEFATKQHACIAIVRLDGYKFRGNYIRMDFAEKRPRPNYNSRRSRQNQHSSNRGRPPATDMLPSNGGTASSSTPSTPRYEAAKVMPSSDLDSIPTTAGAGPQRSSTGTEHIQHNPVYGNTQSSPVYGTTRPSSAGHGSIHPPSVSGGSQPASHPDNLQEPPRPPQSTVRYGTSPGYGKISENNPNNMLTPPSSNTSSYGSSLSAPISRTASRIAEPSGIHDSTGSSISYFSQGTFQQAPSSNGVGSLPGLLDRNSSTQPGISIGDEGVKSTSGWAAPSYNNNPAFGSAQVPASSSSPRASPGPRTSRPASESRQANFGVQERSLTGSVGHVSTQTQVQGYSPSSPYAGYGKIDSFDDPLKSYRTPDKAVVEPWSGKGSFRSGPMYGSPQPSNSNRLFVGNLALSVDDATLQQLFSRFGTVLEARVLRELESGRSRGFGVVAMSSVEEVKAAFEGLDGWRFESRPLKVEAVALGH